MLDGFSQITARKIKMKCDYMQNRDKNLILTLAKILGVVMMLHCNFVAKKVPAVVAACITLLLNILHHTF